MSSEVAIAKSPSRAAKPPRVVVREADAGDNQALLDLATACPMEGDIGLCVDRSPDFFVLNQLAGDSWWLLVAEVEGDLAGCVGAAVREVYWRGERVKSFYLMDLKVHLRYRGLSPGVADRLIRALVRRCRREAGNHRLMINTVLTGNAAAEVKTTAPRGGPHAGLLATLHAWSIPLLLPLFGAGLFGTTIEAASVDDVPEMMRLWRTWAPGWALAPAFHRSDGDDADGDDADGARVFLDRIAESPGLELEDYALLRRRRDRRLLGFWGIWDQSSIKQLRVTHYSPELDRLRPLFDLTGRLTGGPRLPEPGDELGCLVAVHTCTPADRPEILRALLAHAMRHRRGSGAAVLNLGLDARDPRARGLRGIFAQPTSIDIYASTSNGLPYQAPEPEVPLVHHEISLV